MARRWMPAVALGVAIAAAGCMPPNGTRARTPVKPASTASAKPGAKTAASVKALVEKKLRDVSRVSFVAHQAGIVSNNGGGIVSNNGGSAIKKGAGLIGNNGGGIVSNNGGSYRVFADAPRPILVDPGPDEDLLTQQTFVDKRQIKTIARKDGAYGRRVYTTPEGRGVAEVRETVSERWPNGLSKISRVQTTFAAPETGEVVYFKDEVVHLNELGLKLRAELQGAATFFERLTGTRVTVERLKLDFQSGTGEFEIRYGNMDMVETGRITQMEPVAQAGGFDPNMLDPLQGHAGTSQTTTAAGGVLFSQEQSFDAAGQYRRVLDLQDGLRLDLRSSDRGMYGDMVLDSVVLGKARAMKDDQGTTTFELAFQDDPTRLLVIGYGRSGPFERTEKVGASPAASPTPSPSPTGPVPAQSPGSFWWVSTAVGQKKQGFMDGGAEVALLNRPGGIVAGPLNIYVADTRNHRIRTMLGDGPGVQMATWAGSGQAGGKDGVGTAAEFNTPHGLAMGPDGSLYVTEVEVGRIRKITLDGTVTTLAGSGKPGFADGKGAAAQFDYPTTIVVDDAGVAYVADQGNHRIRKIMPDGTVTTVAGSGQKGYLDGRGTAAQLNQPYGVALDGQGGLIVGDTFNGRLRRIDATGMVSTFAGASLAGYIDGDKTKARLNLPTVVQPGPDGSYYFLDGFSVRWLQRDGTVLTIAGLSGVATGYVDGYMTQASFGNPRGFTVTRSGQQLLVADALANSIRVLDLATFGGP